jgi:predicted transposase YbfD/YdcC
MADAIRGHWSMENKLHWVLDVSFAEDQAPATQKPRRRKLQPPAANRVEPIAAGEDQEARD